MKFSTKYQLICLIVTTLGLLVAFLLSVLLLNGHNVRMALLFIAVGFGVIHSAVVAKIIHSNVFIELNKVPEALPNPNEVEIPISA